MRMSISRLLSGAALAAALLLGCSSPDPIPPPQQAEFDQDRAWRDLETIVGFGPRPSGSPANAALRAFIEGELEGAGLTVVREPFTAETPAGPIEFENLYADLPPADPDAPWIIFGTHFDTKRLDQHFPDQPFLGANDAGSGTAILLELARRFAAETEPRRTGLRLLFLDGEEAVRLDWEGNDNTYGSRHHAGQLDANGTWQRYGACVILDMLGDADLEIVHETYSRPELMRLYQEQAQRLCLGEYVATRRRLPVRDDHLPFLNVGIPAVDLIDFDYGPQNSYWHTPEDTLDKCSAKSLGVAGRLVLGAMPALEAWVLER